VKEITTVGLDLAKSWFQVHGADAQGRPLLRKKLARGKLLAFFADLPPCLVGLEACGSAHHWARELSKLGHEVRLIPPQYVRPDVKGNKHDSSWSSRRPCASTRCAATWPSSGSSVPKACTRRAS
jgi:transposase